MFTHTSMASLPLSTINSSSIPHLPILLLFFFILPCQSDSLTCKSQTFSNGRTFDNCVDLPYLGAFLHWTYLQSQSSLSIAFIASPSMSGGWVSWGINPVAEGMVGTQALIAYQQSNGSSAVNTYNVVSYDEVLSCPISLNVSDLSAEYSGGSITVFGKWVLQGSPTAVNQVWQVGPSVSWDGIPSNHDMATANLKSYGTLNLEWASVHPRAESSAVTPPGGHSGASPPPSGSDAGEPLLLATRSGGHYWVSVILISVLGLLFYVLECD